MTGEEQLLTEQREATEADNLPSSVWQRVFVVIPAYNEATAVGDVVQQVASLCPNVIVVDDGSADGTADAARRAGASVLRHVINRGQGAALQTGISYALRRGAEFVVTFDSDGQHQVADIAALVAPIHQGRWDISLGSRFLGVVEDIPMSRRLLLKAGVLFTRTVSGVPITDTHNGLRAFSRRAAERLDIRLDRMAHASEIIDQIRDMHLPYGEVPVHIRYTDYSKAKGQSTSGAIRILFHYFFKRMTQD